MGGEHPRAADTVGISVYRVRAVAVVASGGIAALGGAYLSIGFLHSFTQGMTNGIGFIGLAALIFGKWRPFPTWAALTLVAVAGVIGRSIGPAAAGRPYVKQ